MLTSDRRFVVTVKLNSAERAALERLADLEHLPMSQVVRRLIWQADKHVPDRQVPA